jgi:hypothetical protein
VGKVMMADLVRWNPFDELQKFTDTFDRLVNRWRSGSAWHESPTNASIRGVDDGYRVRIPLPASRPRTSRWRSRAEPSMSAPSSATATPS